MTQQATEPSVNKNPKTPKNGEAAAEDEFLDRLKKAEAQKADAKACRKCGKAMSAKHSRCIYCGEPRPADLM